jgi:uncharacterized membrane protein YdjX (TVP38/TMEM64 family)
MVMSTPEQTNPEKAHATTPASQRRGWIRPVLLLAAVVTVLVLAKVFGLDERLMGVRNWIASLGPWGPVVFVLLYVAATLVAVPGTALTVIAGGLFGSVVGVISVSIGATLGAALAFLTSRYIARESVSRWLSGSERFRRLDEMTERYGGWIVAITRLVPLFPFNLLNYGFGLTKVRFWTYVLWTWLCMLPGTVLYVVGGDAVVTGIKEGRVPWALVGIVAAGLVVLSAVGYVVKRKIVREEPTRNGDNEPDAPLPEDGRAAGSQRTDAGTAPAGRA